MREILGSVLANKADADIVCTPDDGFGARKIDTFDGIEDPYLRCQAVLAAGAIWHAEHTEGMATENDRERLAECLKKAGYEIKGDN